MGILEYLEPSNVFHFSEEISATPRGSTNTRAISDQCMGFAKAHGLGYHQDSFNGIIIIKEATPGYESVEPIVLQGHLGMVCGKEPNRIKDVEKESTDLMADGDRTRVKGTTLGGNSDVVVTMALAVLDSKELSYPRVETILTINEEIGMLSAIRLDMSPSKDGRLISLDSEEERTLTMNRAGGNTTRRRLPITRTPYSGAVSNVMVGGLLGGRSGTDTDKRHVNASMLPGHLLYAVKKKSDFHLISVEDDEKDNAILQQPEALLITANADLVRVIVADMETAFRSEHQENDPGPFIEMKDAATELVPVDEATIRKVLHMLTCIPDGIQGMSADIEGLVRTSLNLGILATEKEELLTSFCLRSGAAAQKQMLVDHLACEMELLGGSIQIFRGYPVWEYKYGSVLRDLMVRTFQKQYGHDPEIPAIHAGLECGMFVGKLLDLDYISIGPDMLGVHTHRGSMGISPIGRAWGYLIGVPQYLKQGRSRKLHGENCGFSPKTWVQSRMRICFIQALCQSLE